MNNGGPAVFVFLIVIVLVILSMTWTFSRSTSIIETWARENGYRLLSSEYRWLAKGPYFFRTSKGQTVYRVTVQDAQGRTRSGYVRCGGWMFGLLSDKVDVRWDDES